MSVFSGVSQSLNTGEPINQVLHGSLLERLFYHHHKHNYQHNHQEGLVAAKEGDDVAREIAQLSSIDFLFYATAVIAIFELLKVISFHLTSFRTFLTDQSIT